MAQTETIILTNYNALIPYLEEIGLIDGDELVINEAFQEDIKDKNVVVSGNLPLHLAVLAHTVTTVPLNIASDMEEQTLTIDDIKELVGDIQKFKVELL